MAKWLGTPPAGTAPPSGRASTRAKDSDRQSTCTILDNALNDGELSAEEHRERVSAATKAVTLGDLQTLVCDLQTGPQPPALDPSPPSGRVRGWGTLAAAFVVSVLLGIGIGWGLYGNTSSPLDFTSDPGAKPDGVNAVVLTPPTQLHSVGGLTGLLEQMRKRFGSTLGYRLVIYPTYAALDRPDPSDDRRVLAYTYRGGWGDPTSSAKSSSDGPVPVDLSKFDVTAAVGIMRGAPETLRMKPSDVKTSYLIVEPATDPTTPGALSLSVYVSSDYGGGYIAFTGDGTVKQMNLPT
ncbi:DUF1707 SHOCT-like domain-containing protein [Mycobacterium avium]|uniref:DUF1707 domain-containing protein n=2 Tax=Mycobacterium avium TaxID=1764 RepID=A0A2A3LE20_MYCAV|nr:DUF1707 domain-containing protein [Mycobacterium avium]APT08978.1 hypothetical protein BS641_00365 [Mycobacterium avium subsp. hominissuis]MBG0727743.1 DUF1707 domain-containing protein [Mycobacterium avium]PBA08937.1 DUF1707 domain-containing protein [Mycobacterium avium]PBA49747.1 DUF1707 domain-containing protein [Mycobacterium avium]PBJ40495.1 DUF1707 domain-containing protein [Mycobacterium avium subsp. hominissuis]